MTAAMDWNNYLVSSTDNSCVTELDGEMQFLPPSKRIRVFKMLHIEKLPGTLYKEPWWHSG